MAALVLSIKTGLLLASSGLSVPVIILFAAALGTSLYGIAAIFADRGPWLAQFIDHYTFLGGLAIAVFLIYLSLQQPRFDAAKGKKLSWGAYAVGLLPCPFCILALALGVSILAPAMGVTVTVLGKKMGLLFGFLVLVLSLIFRKVIQIMGFDFQRVFNGSLLILGLMTLLFALTVPNITNTMEMNFSPIVIEEPFQLLIVVGGLLGLIVWGAFSQRLIVKEERENAGNSRI